MFVKCNTSVASPNTYNVVNNFSYNRWNTHGLKFLEKLHNSARNNLHTSIL